jgi:hypothetical protein
VKQGNSHRGESDQLPQDVLQDPAVLVIVDLVSVSIRVTAWNTLSMMPSADRAMVLVPAANGFALRNQSAI